LRRISRRTHCIKTSANGKYKSQNIHSLLKDSSMVMAHGNTPPPAQQEAVAGRVWLFASLCGRFSQQQQNKATRSAEQTKGREGGKGEGQEHGDGMSG
jgi:hypothetical protein